MKPRSSRRGVLGCRDGILEVAVHSPPEGGKANQELIEVLSKELGVPKSELSLQSGEKSRSKVVSVTGLGDGELQEKLGGAR